MPNLNALVTRRDPLKNYQFIISVEIDQRMVTVGGVQRVSGLTATVSSADTWEGGNNLHRYANPERVTWDNLTLEQGIALDDTLEQWADAVRYYVMSNRLKPSPVGGSGLAVKRNVVIELWPPANVEGPPAPPAQPSRRYRIYNAWISKYVALPKLDALASEVALLTVEIVHEGWTVDLLGPTDSSS